MRRLAFVSLIVVCAAMVAIRGVSAAGGNVCRRSEDAAACETRFNECREGTVGWEENAGVLCSECIPTFGLCVNETACYGRDEWSSYQSLCRVQSRCAACLDSPSPVRKRPQQNVILRTSLSLAVTVGLLFVAGKFVLKF